MSYQVPRMDAAQSRAWLAIVGTAELLPAALDAQLQADAQLTHFEFMVLTTLRRSGATRMTRLAAATNATLPRLSKVVSRMEARGLVERASGDADGRAVSVSLTGDGRRALVRATPGHLDYVRKLVIDRLTPEQLEAVASALEPVVEALDPQHRFGPAAS
ncbi:MarR family winged helix-turn-helix transcriptional regulator [Microbacterium sp. ASV49]|uniref:MarR family winged helix-turn-helix transcriptional regulator n=1 Tax=Microbacterium candidum TaxID=3041922 RepID=A0ABT7MVI8_9MICO|nr:MarR family winged helix-turn-helix transcriptional regulator [Microbacterium sp. ASV49]MDL9978469.1 MarR family winged helix-turn-helix transcriptional regulator [Microbacterium sp. ASV49]